MCDILFLEWSKKASLSSRWACTDSGADSMSLTVCWENRPVANNAANLRRARALFWSYDNVTVHIIVPFLYYFECKYRNFFPNFQILSTLFHDTLGSGEFVIDKGSWGRFKDHGVGSTDHFLRWKFGCSRISSWTQWGLALLCHFSLFSLECLLFEKVFVNLQPKETKLWGRVRGRFSDPLFR